jgi:hypothetical protein
MGICTWKMCWLNMIPQRNPQLIDFGQARFDHVLHDLLRLESSLILHLLPSLLAEKGYPATMSIPFTNGCTRVMAGQRVRPHHRAWSRSLRLCSTSGTRQNPYLGPTGDWAEYYQGLTLYMLGALKYDNLDEPVAEVVPKAIAFWGAATIQQLVQTGEIPMKQ